MNCIYTCENASLSYCNQEEYESIKASGLDIPALLCAKHPYHKQIVGYEKNCPKNHPEYLVSYKPNEHLMALNMIDAEKPEFFSDEMIFAGLRFIDDELAKSRNVVVVCNKGESRSPSMCLLYLMANNYFDKKLKFSEVFSEFENLALNWNPKSGILQYCINFWDRIKRSELHEKIYR